MLKVQNCSRLPGVPPRMGDVTVTVIQKWTPSTKGGLCGVFDFQHIVAS
jgi:hypothetical protein